MRWRRYFLAPALGLLVAGLAPAQTTQGTTTVGPSTGTQSGEGGNGGTPLYTYPEVARELNLSQSQIDRLNSVTSQMQAKHISQRERLSRLSGAERVRRLNELNASMGGDWRRAASQILTAKQMQRYAQIELQVAGLEAFSDAELQKKLNLKPTQLQKLQSLRAQARREQTEVRLLARDNLRAASRRHERYRQRWYEAADKVLDGDQRREWREMTGGNFNYKPNMTSPELYRAR